MNAPELDEFLPQLRDSDPEVRSFAAGALGALGSDGIPTITPLYEACQDIDMYVRGEALHSLWEIAGSCWDEKSAAAWPLLEAGIPTLIALLDDPWWSARCSAMTLLKELGSAAAPALPSLQALLTEEISNLTAHPEEWGLETEIRLIRESATGAIEAINMRQYLRQNSLPFQKAYVVSPRINLKAKVPFLRPILRPTTCKK